MILKQHQFLFVLYIFLTSCLQSEKSDTLVTVYNEELSINNILENLPEDMLDTSFFIQRYKEKWVRTKLMEHHADMNLSNDLKDYEKQVNEYRSSLLIFAYQEQLVNQNFDTTITNEEIERYYMANKDKFKLNKNIFQGRFIMLAKDAPKQDRLLSIFKSKDIDDKDELLEYCKQFAEKYYLQDSSWLYFSFITNQLPNHEILNEEDFLRKTNFLEFIYEDYKYILFIKDYQIKGSVTPLDLEYDKIKMVILNKNKLAYLEKIEDKLYQQAISLGKIKYY
ncbi:MAG: hypothetical protein VX370_03780 [Bacteroidota bacterium]|nr:hypothetical protein [Bacteroidota bacterium]